jgi:signal peptidase I
MSLGRLVFLVGVALAVVLPVRTWVGEPIVVVSPSMEPTLRVGTLLILDKMSLSGRRPARGEVVSFPSPERDGRDLIKRVIALPGESVELREKVVYIDGKPLEEPYAVHSRAGERLVGDNLGPLEVPPGMIFVLGDNRDESNDSSVWKDAQGNPTPFIPIVRLQGLVRRLPWA